MKAKVRRVTSAEFAWQARQPVCPPPSLRRLREALKSEGFSNVQLRLHDDGEGMDFRLGRGTKTQRVKGDQLHRLLIRICRNAGFAIGYEELAVKANRASIMGITLTGPIAQVAEHGAPAIELEERR